jgi:ketol-acid reductoisomerase
MTNIDLYSINKDSIKNMNITIIGYGNQAKSQALNLKDYGCNVTIGLRNNSESIKDAKKKFKVKNISESIKDADIIIMLIPDICQPKLYNEVIKDNIKKSCYIGFAHGFSICYNLIKYDSNKMFLVAPKAPGKSVRNKFLNNESLAIAIQNPINSTLAYEYAYAITNGKVKDIFETTFKEETETDLFGEQAILCGGLIELIEKSYNLLIEKGYSKDISWHECIGEIKYFLDLIEKNGTDGIYDHVSELASYGGKLNRKKIINEKALNEILDDIKSKKFVIDFLYNKIKLN